MLARDLIDDVRIAWGGCDDARSLVILSDAIEALANKGQWDPLMRYLDLPVSGGLVVLPASVETPIRATINNVPAFARDRFYEFSLNGPGPGETSRPVAFAYAEELETPLMTAPPAAPFKLRFQGDDGGGIYVSGEVNTGPTTNLRRVKLTTAFTGSPDFTSVLEVEKGATINNGDCDLYASSTGGDVLLGRYSAQDTHPRFRRLRISRPDATSIRLWCRMRTFRLTSVTDFIPLHSRLALVFMVRALRQYDLLNDGAGQAYEAKALQYLTEEQTSRNSAEAVAEAQQIDSALGLNLYAPGMLTAGDVYDAFAEIYGPIGRQKLFDRITDAVEALANKANWSPLLIYVVLAVQNSRYVTLPPNIEAVLDATIEGAPAFARDRFYEFSLNGPGSADGDRASAGWEDLGESPLARDPAGVFQLKASVSSSRILADGTGFNGGPLRGVPVPSDGSLSVNFVSVTRLYCDPAYPSDQTVTVTAMPDDFVVATFGGGDPAPLYRRLRLSKVAQGVRMLCRRRTARLGALNDLIPLHSRLAVVTMGRALKALATGQGDALGLQTQAVTFLTDEENSRNAAVSKSAAGQDAPAIGLPLHSRDVLTAGDVYDEMARILGPVGRQRIFDALTDAVLELENKSAGGWDSQLGVVDLIACPSADGVFTLPREVDEVLAVRFNRHPLTLRNRWMEFHADGQCRGWGALAGGWLSCGEWEKLPTESPTINDLVVPSRLIACLAANDGDPAPEPLIIYGRDDAGLEIYQDGRPGMRLPIRPAGTDPATLANDAPERTLPPVSVITRVVKATTRNYVTLDALAPVSLAPVLRLGYYYPDRLEPSYRRIRVPARCGAAALRVAFRRRQEAITAFSDVIFLRSRRAVLSMVRALKLQADGDVAGAEDHEQLATRALVEEQAARNPGETVSIQFSADSGFAEHGSGHIF